jgi:pyruvate,water dikinase
LVDTGEAIQSLFGELQDIEWAFSGGELFLLQARPITTLFPIPQRLPPSPLHVLVSLGAIQGLLTPLSPLGRSTLSYIFASLRHVWDSRY